MSEGQRRRREVPKRLIPPPVPPMPPFPPQVLEYGRVEGPVSGVPVAVQVIVGMVAMGVALWMTWWLVWGWGAGAVFGFAPLVAVAMVAVGLRKQFGWQGFERGAVIAALLAVGLVCLLVGYCFYGLSKI